MTKIDFLFGVDDNSSGKNCQSHWRQRQ